MYRLIIATSFLLVSSLGFAAGSLKDYNSSVRDYEQIGYVSTVNLEAYRINIDGKQYNLSNDAEIIVGEGQKIQQGSKVEYSLNGEMINGVILLK